MLINDQLCVIDQAPRMLRELKEGKTDMMVDIAKWGDRVGTDIVAILIEHIEVDEVAMLPKIAVDVHNAVGCPIGLDSRNPEALEAALSALQPYTCIVFTVSGDTEIQNQMLPIIKKYNAVIAGMPMGQFSAHVPMTVEERLAESRFIVDACEGYGISKDNIVIDAICMAAATMEPNHFMVSLETIQAVHQELGVAVQLGIGNAGSGMPDPTRFDLAYLMAAMAWGVDSAFVNPMTISLVESARAMDMLTERDPVGVSYLDDWRSAQGIPKPGSTFSNSG